MYKTTVLLQDAKRANEFVHICNQIDGRIELASGPYVMNAKSIMGIFSLDLSKPIAMEVYDDACDDLLEEIKPFII